MARISARSSSTEDTFNFGREFGRCSEAGDTICLIGDLGAGKTHFTQGIAAGLGLAREAVTSPTYSLIAEQIGGRIPLYHMDAYRLIDTSELGPIGFDEYLNRCDGILVIEWADRIVSALPTERVDTEILHPMTSSEALDHRTLVFRPLGKRAVQHVYDALAIM